VVAFITSWIILALGIAVIWYVGTRREIGAPMTWGEAMIAAVFAFFLMFWAYGVVPHQFLAWADNELGWRADRVIYGPWDVLKPDRFVPFTLTYQTLRDILVSAIYGVMLGLQVVLWAVWQDRAKRRAAAPELATSTYGRPLVRKG
jgi:hypothetical protein